MTNVQFKSGRNGILSSVLTVIFVSAISVTLGGCSSSKDVAAVQMADATIRDARTAVRQAEQRGARNHAPLELRSADQKLEAAQIALTRGEVDYALLLAEEAEVDAELAEITALSTKSQKAVSELRESIKMLREEIKRYQSN